MLDSSSGGSIIESLLATTSSSSDLLIATALFVTTVAVLLPMALATTAQPPFFAKLEWQRLCFLCPPEASNDDEENSIRDNNGILFIPKGPNTSFETTLLTATSHEESEDDDVVPRTAPRRKVSVDPSIRTSDSTAKQGHAKCSAATAHKVTVKVPTIPSAPPVPSIEETKGSIDEKESDSDDDDCFFNIQCASKYEYADDDQSDASSLTVPSFRNNNKQGARRSLTPRSKMLQKVQKAVFNSVKALRHKSKGGDDNNVNFGVIENVPSCSCLILLIDPTSHTFEILPVQYFPGVSAVSDILEQIPLQSSFNFRLRFQPYTGLMEVKKATAASDEAPTSYQLPQSKPVPMRYSCEFHHYQEQQQQEDSSSPSPMMPLVAILPERMTGTSPSSSSDATTSSQVNMVETTERLARKLLSEPGVLKRLEHLQDVVLTASAKGDDDSADDDDLTDRTD